MRRNLLKKVFVAGSLLCLSLLTNAQTAGSLTFSCSTTAPSGSWGDKHVMAVWIENTENPSVFIKTNAKYGSEDDHLTSWIAKSGKNLVDAVTGATLTTYQPASVIWDGTNIDKVVVTDGTYNVFIEMGWGKDKVNQHSLMSFTFTKGMDEVHLTPTGNNNYTDVTVDWVPAVSIINSYNDNSNILVYPNPNNGSVFLDIKKSLNNAYVQIINPEGKEIYNQIIEYNYTGILEININTRVNGLYMLRVISPDINYTYKLVMNKL